MCIYYDCNIRNQDDVFVLDVCFVFLCVCSHHYESEVVGVGVAVVRALDL